jgi:uncharacterized protein
MTSKRLVQILLGLSLTLVVGSLPFPVWDNEFADTAHLVGNELIYWVLVAATLAYVVGVERMPLRSIGFRAPTMRDALAALVVAVASVAGLAVMYFVVFPALHISEDQQIDKLMNAPAWWLAISVVRAGVSEEILFRGYPVERLQELSGSRFVAFVVPLVAFTLAHVGPWGWSHVFVAAFGGAMLTGLYLWRRNLWVSLLAHCLIDGVAVLAG